MRLAVTAGALLFGCALVELAVRALDLGPPPMFRREGELFRASEIEGLRFESRPGAVQRLIYPKRGGGAPDVVEMRVNAAGFRGPAPELAKASGVTRVLCVGDSHTFGWGVPEGATWPDRLREELASRRPDARFEVLNAGVDNYDTVQEVLLLEQRLLAYEPDLVVLQFYVNDAAVHGVAPVGEREPDLVLRWTDPSRTSWLSPLREHSRFLDLACDWLYRRHGLSTYSDRRTRLYAEGEPGWELVRASLRRARDVLAERDVPFAVALFPFLVREGDALTSHRAFELVRAFCDGERIACIDAEPAFLALEVDPLRVSPHDYHANAAGHRVFAAAVCEGLEREGLLASAIGRMHRSAPSASRPR